MVTDSAGTGMFLPFTVLYFVHTAGLTAPAVGVALTVAGFVVLPAPLAAAPGIGSGPDRRNNHISIPPFRHLADLLSEVTLGGADGRV